jgi:hypothetical protein
LKCSGDADKCEQQREEGTLSFHLAVRFQFWVRRSGKKGIRP